jgi:hypothetical protein
MTKQLRGVRLWKDATGTVVAVSPLLAKRALGRPPSISPNI